MLCALALLTLLGADEVRTPLVPAAELPQQPELRPFGEEVPDAVVTGPAQLSEDWERARVVRIGATALGGAVGIALPLLLGWGWQRTQPSMCAPFSPCDTPYAVTSTFLPLTAGLGLGIGHTVAGGRAGTGFGLAGALAGYMTATGALGLISVASGKNWAAGNGVVAGGGFMATASLVGAVGALELREAELQAGAKEWSLGRGIVSGLAFWLPATLTEVAVVYGSIAVGYASRDGSGSALLMTFGTLANYALSSVAAWGAHRGMGGKGELWAGAVGAVASTTIATGFFALHAHAPPNGGIFRGGTNFPITISVLTCLIAVMGPAVGLEWSNAVKAAGETDVVEPPAEPKRRVPVHDIQVQAGPSQNGGALLSLSGRF